MAQDVGAFWPDIVWRGLGRIDGKPGWSCASY